MDDLVIDFVCEAAEGLGGLQAGLARLMADRADPTAASDMLRRLHGVKGMAGFLGFARAEALAHAGESLLTALDVFPAGASYAALAPLSEMIERLGELFAHAAEDRAEPEGDDADLIAQMEMTAAILGSHVGSSVEPTSPYQDSVLPDVLHAAGIVTDRRARAPWSGLDSLARALGDRLGKRIELMVGGDDLRVVPEAVAPLRTALIALVRNACDHGVESPSERRAALKPARALIRLSVHRNQDGAVIELADDGRGIDPARIRLTCTAQGRLSEAAAAAMADAEALALVFAPGVTTVESVTALSGRGLGLELVRREVEGLGGKVQVASAPGQGARFILTLPATVLASSTARGRVAA
jgi:two-component system chemotaxis sensor kinase CheA